MKTVSDAEKALLAQIRLAIRTEFRKRGHGSQQKVLDTLGIKKSTFNAAFREGSLKVTMLWSILGALELDPGKFFTANFKATEEPPGIPPLEIREALKKLEDRGDE